MDQLVKIYTEEIVERAFTSMETKFRNRSRSNCCFIMVLKGGAFVGFELLRRIKIPIIGSFGFMKVSRRRGSDTSACGLDLSPKELVDRQIWIVDDIVDSGLTVDAIRKYLLSQHVVEDNIRICTLVERIEKDKPRVLNSNDIVGISHKGPEFLLGCGMGLGEKYRDMKCIAKLATE